MKNSVFHLIIRTTVDTADIQIIVKTLDGKMVSLTVSPSETVEGIKRKLEKQEGIRADRQMLYFKGNIAFLFKAYLIFFPYLSNVRL